MQNCQNSRFWDSQKLNSRKNWVARHLPIFHTVKSDLKSPQSFSIGLYENTVWSSNSDVLRRPRKVQIVRLAICWELMKVVLDSGGNKRIRSKLCSSLELKNFVYLEVDVANLVHKRYLQCSKYRQSFFNYVDFT